jgi:hypothetical protein
VENCDSCDIDDQPNPEAECAACEAQALAKGRLIGIHPSTGQILDIRNMIKAGYRFAPDDLAHWQWQALVAVDQAIEKHQAERIRQITGK